MIIDGHAHACGDFLTVEGILERLNEAGVDKVVLVPGELDSTKNYSIPYLAKIFPNIVQFMNYVTKVVISTTGSIKHIHKGNKYVYFLSKQTEGRVLQYLWITQQESDPIKYLSSKLSEWKFKGIKMHQCWERFSINSSYFINVAGWAEKNDLPLFIHLYSNKDVDEIIKYKKKHPGLKLIIAHIFGINKFVKENLRDDNLYFDLSSFQLTSKRRWNTTIKNIGIKNILLGSDTPYGKNTLKRNIERVEALNISSAEKDLILGGNLCRLLKL